MNTNRLQSQAAIRAAFWRENPQAERKLIMNYAGTARNMHTTDTRCAFSVWLDMAHRDGRVSDRLAQAVTL